MAETKLCVADVFNHSFVGKTLYIFPQVGVSKELAHGHPCEAES